MAAEKVTPTAINFMATHGRGLICLSLTEDRIRPARAAADGAGQHLALRHRVHRLHRGRARRHHRHLGRRPRADHPRRRRARRRSRATSSARATCSRSARATGGVLVRTGQTEGSVDLARLAGLFPAGVICEVMNADGTMARRPSSALRQEARAHAPQRRRPHPLPAPERAAGEAGGQRRAQPSRAGHLDGARLPERRRLRRAHRDGEGRHQRPAAGAHPHAPRLSGGRPARQRGVRLRQPAASRPSGPSPRRGAGCWSTCTRRVRPASALTLHPSGGRGGRTRRRPQPAARVRGGRADPQGPRPATAAPVDQQSQEDRRPGELFSRGRGADSASRGRGSSAAQGTAS